LHEFVFFRLHFPQIVMLHHCEEFYVLRQFKIPTCKTATICVFHRIYKSLLLW